MPDRLARHPTMHARMIRSQVKTASLVVGLLLISSATRLFALPSDDSSFDSPETDSHVNNEPPSGSMDAYPSPSRSVASEPGASEAVAPETGRPATTSTGSLVGRQQGGTPAPSSLVLTQPPTPASTPPEQPPAPLADSAPIGDSEMSVSLGEVRSLQVADLQRIAIGNPDTLDATIVSSNEILVQPKKAGSTNVILWDRHGKRTIMVRVIDRAREAVEMQLKRLLQQLNLPDVRVEREEDRLFLVGQVPRTDDVSRLSELADLYKGQVTNLVGVSPAAPAAPAPLAQVVRLGVQVIELNRSDVEKLGVKWSQDVAYTQPAASFASNRYGAGIRDALFKWGTTVNRSSVTADINALVQKKRARVLAEPKLVTASGKEASSLIGLEVPILTATSVDVQTDTVSTNVQYRKTGVLLKITPTAHSGDQHGKITTVIEAEISSISDDANASLSLPVGATTIKVPGFKVRRVNTQVTAGSGETIMIAGLLESEDTKNIDQIPAFGSIPVIGRLFRSPEISSSQQEILIAVTPELEEENQEDPTTEKIMALEQALADGETGHMRTPAERYAAQVQDRLAQGIRYPEFEKTRGMTGFVKLRLHLSRDGEVIHALIAQSSGNASFDREALAAAKRQAPYPAFPFELSQQDLWVDLPVVFNP